ncbi:uncharacterized protein LOC126676622 [Mercurialis annua]|uniref:uncharacterized protein LOC126676622 n=1 Tax=Mercurialis annua TaxID=3986 RepID=UPI00215F8B5C|nr:uncharacterized protein LOC126676622 [Mercurialis annua]
MKSKKETISLESYLDFFNSQKQINLNIHFLNQIICMHGFKKMTKQLKKAVTEAVDSIDLVSLSRSTLGENSSSSTSKSSSCDAFISVEEVIADLNAMNWQDCCITSVQTLIFSSENNSRSSNDDLVDDSAVAALNCGSKKRKRTANKVVAGGSVSNSALISFGSC